MFKEFVKELNEKGIVISVSNGKIKYSGNVKYIDEEMINKLKKYKPKLIKYFWPYDCYNMMPINTDGRKIPFTLLHAGKSVYQISEYLGNDQPFYGFFDEGSDDKKIKFKDVESFAKEYRRQIQKIIVSYPYILGGLSFGGVLAFEIALQLQEEGKIVPLLVLGDCEISYYRKINEKHHFFFDKMKEAYHFVQNIYFWIYFRTGSFFYNLMTMLKIYFPPDYRKSYIIWTYFKLLKKYKPQKKFIGEILLFKTNSNGSPQKFLGWDRFCDNVTVIDINGTHQSMYEDEDVIKVLSVEIGTALQKLNSRCQKTAIKN